MTIDTISQCTRCEQEICNLCGIDGLCCECIQADLTYLRDIEAAVRRGNSGEEWQAVVWWRLMAMPEPVVGSLARAIFGAIAKALEAKP